MRIISKPKTCFLLALAALSLCITGCIKNAVGSSGSSVGTYYHGLGELRADEPNDMDRLYAASENAMKDMGFSLVEHTKDRLLSKIVAQDEKGKKIRLALENTNPNRIELRIRVGVAGDEKESIAVLEKINSHF